jgi:hypothetical protein
MTDTNPATSGITIRIPESFDEIKTNDNKADENFRV